MPLFSRNKEPRAVPRRRLNDRERVSESSSALEQASYTFQRNRTITGSASSQVRSVGEKTADVQSDRVKLHHLHRKRRHLAFYWVLLAGFAGLMYLAMMQFVGAVNPQPIDPTVRLDTTRYQRAMQEYFARHPVERLLPALDKQRLLQYMREEVSEVENVLFEKDSPLDYTRMIVTARKPLASWKVDGTSMYVDRQGVSFTKNYYAEPSVTIIDDNPISTQKGLPLASNRFIGFIGRVINYCAEKGSVVKEVRLPRGTTRQIVIMLDGTNYTTKMTVDRPAGEQAEDMLRVAKYIKTNNLNVEYIDVRVAGRAYYKDK